MVCFPKVGDLFYATLAWHDDADEQNQVWRVSAIVDGVAWFEGLRPDGTWGKRQGYNLGADGSLSLDIPASLPQLEPARILSLNPTTP